MSTTPGSYQCTLDEKTLQKAKEELNEDPKQRMSQIETFREWIKSQPHINSRLDDGFLLRFLRTAKFSQLRAQEILENFWTARSVEGKGAPDWFKDLDPNNAKLQEIVDLGCALPLPGRDDEGRKVLLIKTGAYDPKVHDFADVMKVGFMLSDIMLMDEMNQVHGFAVLLDFSQFSASHVWNWNRETISKSSKCWQDTYPMRQKAVNHYNTPTVFNALFEIFQYFSKEKMKKRVFLHKSSLESLHKQVPKRILPSEYGGDAGPIKELIKDWKTQLINSRDEILSLGGDRGIDESKRPKVEKKNSDGWGGVLGSFRKLDVE